ncbi:MAG: TlpA disulfide reductase family protein [Acidobacteriaceae bacterium]
MLRNLSALALLLSFATAANAKPVPNLKFHDLAGHVQRLDSLHGSITVLVFWATWCTPCREELPRLSQLSQQYAAQGVRFLAISVDDPADFAKIQPLFHKQNINLTVWTGADTGTLSRLGLGDVVPATLVLDTNGDIIGRISGEARDADVTTYLDWLLHHRQGPAPAPRLKRY